MKAKCLLNQLTDDQKVSIFGIGKGSPVYQITAGKTYLVVGLSFVVDRILPGNTMYDVVDDAGRCIPTPACLFEIVDPRVSKHWQVELVGQSGLRIWPELFYEDDFLEDLSNHVPETVQKFRNLVRTLEFEFVN